MSQNGKINFFSSRLFKIINRKEANYISMLTFKSVQLEDRSTINLYLDTQNYRASDLCFTNLYTWGRKFNTEYAVENGWLIIRFRDNNNRNSYLKPIGKGNLKEGIDLIMSDHNSFDSVFQIRGLTNEMIEEVEEALPNVFEYKLNRSVSDYIYTSEKLINLKGKKLQSKRNHINRFMRENDWKYVSLKGRPDLVNECKEMLHEWIEINTRAKDDSLDFDDFATTLMLENFDYLELQGGLICVNSEIQAFTIGEKLTEDTFIVHVEKAFTELHGAYTIINQQFVENEASHYTYINREEDMGIENLRKAKMSYQPDILLEKYVARLK